MTTEGGGLFGAPRRDGQRPKLVVIGILWAAFGIVALIAAVLMRSAGFAVFGVLCVLAGGGLYLGQQARERLESDERSWRSDPGGYPDEPPEPEDEPESDDGAPPDPDRQHATRVMSTGSDHDDIVDAEYTEYVEYEPSPSEQDDGTGYDDEETAFQRRRQDEWTRDGARAREDDTRVIEADDEDTDDRRPGDGDHGGHGEGHDHGEDHEPTDRSRPDASR